MLFHNGQFGEMNCVLNVSPYTQTRIFAGDPIPPPPTRLSMLSTSDGNMVMTSDGNGLYMNNVDE